MIFKEISNLSTEASFEALLNSDWRIESALNKLFNPAVPNNTIPPPVVGPVSYCYQFIFLTKNEYLSKLS